MNRIRAFIPAAAFVLSNDPYFNPAILIPVYNHEHAISVTLGEALQQDCPVLLVDDGCDAVCRDVLVALSEKYPARVMLLRLEQNGGKGAAVKAGMKALLTKGHSHAVQIDADGQHDLSDLPIFLEMGEKNSKSLVTGYPKFDESIPKARYYSRYLTHVWVWINTLSFKIRDTMCGFRVYPLKSVMDMLEQEPCGDRMSFDTEVIVRWFWRDGEIINIPTFVGYPIDGVSHFDVWQDNFLITMMHTRLFFGMLRRFPRLFWRRFNG